MSLPLSRGDNCFGIALNYNQVLNPSDYTPEDLSYYTFFDSTIFIRNEKKAQELIETGKNPRLCVCGLHDDGITGKVHVAVIDQNMYVYFIFLKARNV